MDGVIALIEAYNNLFPDDEHTVEAHVILSDFNMSDAVILDALRNLPKDDRRALLLHILMEIPENIRDQPQAGWDCPHCGAEIWSYERPAKCQNCRETS